MENLEQVKKLKSSDKNEKKESINKSLASIESELRKIKNKKKELNELMAKIRESSKQKLEIYLLIDKIKLREKYIKEYSICTQLHKPHNANALKVIHSLLSLYFDSRSRQKLSKVVDSANQFAISNFSGSLEDVYSTLLGTSIQDIKNSEHLIKWFLSDFRLAFVTNSPDKLIEKLQNAHP